MSLQACADIVARADPDRFAAAMAAPVAARRVLFPIYAFNAEVARAPWVTSEPMIAEMRLQWWRDALEEIGQGGQVRAHEVTTPLAEVLDAEGASVLTRLVEARRWDIYRDAFEDGAQFRDYLADTGGAIMWAGARALGADPADEDAIRGIGWAQALANFLRAIPDLEARGRVPLVDGRAEAIRDLAEDEGLGRIAAARTRRYGPAVPALRAAWLAEPVLWRVVRNPRRVADGTLAPSEASRRLRLLWKAVTNDW